MNPGLLVISGQSHEYEFKFSSLNRALKAMLFRFRPFRAHILLVRQPMGFTHRWQISPLQGYRIRAKP
jgi:hypothetical protein